MNKWLQMSILAAAVAGGAFFAQLMSRMLDYMGHMTAHVEALGQDVRSMTAAVQSMSAEVSRMQGTLVQLHTSVARMDQAIYRGSEQFQRMNPMDIIQQAMPPGMGGEPRR